MTKKDIALKISEQSGIRQVDAKKAVQMTLDFIVEALSRGEVVELRNFGVFKVKTRRAMIGRNPKTGTTVPIPERKTVAFKVGMIMKKKVK